jgi:dihydroxyacetone kinase-like protein
MLFTWANLDDNQKALLNGGDTLGTNRLNYIAGDLNAKGDALLFVNGFGATPVMELYLMFNAAKAQLAKHGINPARALVGNYVTLLDMAGCSITVTMLDEEIAQAWDAPVHTPALRWGL